MSIQRTHFLKKGGNAENNILMVERGRENQKTDRAASEPPSVQYGLRQEWCQRLKKNLHHNLLGGLNWFEGTSVSVLFVFSA